MLGLADDDKDRILRRLRLGRAGALEAVASAPQTEAEALHRLSHYLTTDAFDRLSPEIKAAVREVLAPGADAGRLGLEAVVRTTGRPALPIQGGFVDLNQPEAAAWGQLHGFEAPIRRLTCAVGRIDLNGVHVGTGFVVAHGLILTNRHVLEELAREFDKRDGGRAWLFSAGEVSINFDAELGSTGAKRFSITGVHAAGPEVIGGRIDLSRADAAVFEVATTNADGDVFPDPLTFARPGSQGVTTAVDIVSVGCPGPPTFAPSRATPTAVEVEIMQALVRIFQYRRGVKRLSPGAVMEPAGHVIGDLSSRIFTHDASTLGGASGSAIAYLDGADPLVIGLHFGGEMLRQNFGLTVASLKDSLLASLPVVWGA